MAKKEEVYNVEKIVDARFLLGKQQYLIKWEGYGDEHNTWEYEKDIFCKDLIEEYEEAIAAKAKSNTQKKPTLIDDKRKKTGETKKRKLSSPTEPVKVEEASTKKDEIKLDITEESIKRIITVQKYKGGKSLVVQIEMKNGNTMTVPAALAAKDFPRALIRFYEDHLTFVSDEEENKND